jgi:hypothetical protein
VPTDATHAAERGWRGKRLTSVFQGLSPGKRRQPPAGVGAGRGRDGATTLVGAATVVELEVEVEVVFLVTVSAEGSAER